MRHRYGHLASGVLAVISASVLLATPASADEVGIEGGTVSVTVQIDPLECVTGCGGGSLPGTDLPATGMVGIEPLLWIAIALLVAGAVFALKARTARQGRALAPSASSTAYAVDSGERAPMGEDPSADEPSVRRRSERGDRA
ncbi:hypothetical protein [Microbacterium trichothecenolyticum]|uniref:LPXTG-motif cell wall-anchored protein n=1 Tax=Microbacterium trichothecenolyticum TaxID=69370 RepID=A0A0M2HG07_MICTR|nr:hypothetical protein [Microbacterium trichothecenolyticum]KJL43651.1 hypothetical protein RS82_01347 [Microbacterium trichothecenolyticum]